MRSICRFSCGLRDLQAGLLMQPGASVSIQVSSYSMSLISSSTSFFSSLLCLTFAFLCHPSHLFHSSCPSFLPTHFCPLLFISRPLSVSNIGKSFLVDLLLLLLLQFILPPCVLWLFASYSFPPCHLLPLLHPSSCILCQPSQVLLSFLPHFLRLNQTTRINVHADII